MSTKFESHVAIEKDKREKLVGLLNEHLATAIDLSLQVKQAHWNVRGPHFLAHHELVSY